MKLNTSVKNVRSPRDAEFTAYKIVCDWFQDEWIFIAKLRDTTTDPHPSRERIVLSNISSIGYYAFLTDTPIEVERTDHRCPVQTEPSAQEVKIDSTEEGRLNVTWVVRSIPDKRKKSANLLNLRYDNRCRLIVHMITSWRRSTISADT